VVTLDLVRPVVYLAAGLVQGAELAIDGEEVRMNLWLGSLAQVVAASGELLRGAVREEVSDDARGQPVEVLLCERRDQLLTRVSLLPSTAHCVG
jgi:hypothetical protein